MSRARGGTDRAAQVSAALSVAAAVVVAVLLNVLGARHYERWDWTRDRRYTLSDATVQLLAGLQEPIAVHVLISAADPLTVSVRHTLTALRAHTQRLDVRFVDPDRDPAAYLALQRRYGLLGTESEEPSPETEAAIVVARGSRHHVIAYEQLEGVSVSSETPVEPSIERSLGSAIRDVLASAAPKVCFTVGHGEDSLDDFGPQGLATLADRLRSNNLEATALDPLGRTPGADPIGDCSMVVVAGPKQPFAAPDVARLVSYFDRGGRMLLALGPVPDLSADRTVDIGLGELLHAASVKLVDEIVFELDPSRRAAHGLGEAFFAEAKPHDVTAALTRSGRDAEAGVYLEVAGYLEADEGAPVPSRALLVSSDRSFAMRDFFGWARAPRVPEASERDRRGPVVLARATELVRPDGAASHRSRMVVVATSSVLHGANWQLPELRTTALFVQGALGWLSAEPLVFAADGAARAASDPRLTEEALSAALRYALLYVPLGVVLLGVAVAIRRRSKPGSAP